MKKTLSFDDVLIQPCFSTITSRKECDTKSKLGNITLDLPIISSNMDTVTSGAMANVMFNSGGLGALHRFCTVEENVEMFQRSFKETFVSIGLGEKEIDRAKALLEAGAYNFILDVAHGANLNVVKQYKELRRYAGHDAHIMVGNFSSSWELFEFEKALQGSQLPDSIKVGIGGGSMCTTRIVTGCGMPTLESVIDLNHYYIDHGKKIPIVADGGIKNSGDIAKALAAGASAVMIGSLLSGTDETPGEVVDHLGTPNYSTISILKFKKYRGSASAESYEVQGKTATHRSPEGVSTLVPYKGPVTPILEQLKAGLQSAMSYVNARTMAEFRENAELIEITNAGMLESKPHGKR